MTAQIIPFPKRHRNLRPASEWPQHSMDRCFQNVFGQTPLEELAQMFANMQPLQKQHGKPENDPEPPRAA